MSALLVAAVVLAAFGLWKYWYNANIGVCTSTRRMDGKTALITGANTGIGLETARDLARRGARVLIACRDPERGRTALDDIVSSTGNKNVELLRLDLSSLASVRECAAKVIAKEKALDVLVNNAGVIGLGDAKSKDNLHAGMQTNHLGPFLFTLLLLDLLKKSAPSRIVFVSALLHKHAKLTPESLEYEHARKVSNFMNYNNSKLANILTSNELARKLKGTGITVNSLHPGVIKTELSRHQILPLRLLMSFYLTFFKTVVEGAQTQIYLAVSEEVEGVTGRYFSDCREAGMSKEARDEGLAKRLWEKSEHLVGLKNEERFF